MTLALSVGAAEFVPGKYWGGLPEQEESDYIWYLKDILYQLSINPGSFQDNMNSLTEILTGSIREDWQLDEVADIIFEQSTMEPNFTYTGARVIAHLQRMMPIPPGRKPIRMLINHRAKDVVVRRKEMAVDAAQQKRLHGVTMFMAELFMNMEIIGSDGTLQKIKVYRVALQELFQSLTDYPSAANLKCLGNIFKLAGKTIEDYDRGVSNTASSELINKIFNDGRNYIVNGQVDRYLREQWLQLIEFRATDWGRRPAKGQSSRLMYEQPGPAGAGAVNGAAGDVFTNMPVFYNAKGTVISAQEAGFKDEDFKDEEFNAEDYNYDDDDTDPNNLNFDPGLNVYGWQPEIVDGAEPTPDMEDAYEQFLRETGQDDPSGLSWGVE